MSLVLRSGRLRRLVVVRFFLVAKLLAVVEMVDSGIKFSGVLRKYLVVGGVGRFVGVIICWEMIGEDWIVLVWEVLDMDVGIGDSFTGGCLMKWGIEEVWFIYVCCFWKVNIVGLGEVLLLGVRGGLKVIGIMKFIVCFELFVVFIGIFWMICMWDIEVVGWRWMKGSCNIVGGWFGNCIAILWICFCWLFFLLIDCFELYEFIFLLDLFFDMFLFFWVFMKSDIKVFCGGVFFLISVEVFLILVSFLLVGGEGYFNLKRLISGFSFWMI